jgi:hypothetical protein
MRLNDRLTRLEALAPPPAPPAKEITDDDRDRFIDELFTTKQLWFDATGTCVLGPVGVWHDKEFKLEMAKSINEWRCQTGEQFPILPMQPDDAAQAIEFLRAGTISVVNRPCRIDNSSVNGVEEYFKANRPVYLLRICLEAFEASGGKVEWTNEAIIELLSQCKGVL